MTATVAPTSATRRRRAKKKPGSATDTPQPGAWRSRIVGTGSEDPTQLVANPKNWRIHPKGQQDALGSVLDEVGWVQQVLVNRTTGHVVDGHLRVELAIGRDEPAVPVLYVELTEAEEALVLASLDPARGSIRPRERHMGTEWHDGPGGGQPEATGRGIVEVAEMIRTGRTVWSGRFKANRVVALVEHPAIESEGGVDETTRRLLGSQEPPRDADGDWTELAPTIRASCWLEAVTWAVVTTRDCRR